MAMAMKNLHREKNRRYPNKKKALRGRTSRVKIRKIMSKNQAVTTQGAMKSPTLRMSRRKRVKICE
jgi:hypothetical protein